MADSSVFIDGAAEGAFVDALVGMPPWATEYTAYKIQGLLEKQLGVQNKMLAQLVKAATGGAGAKNLSGSDLKKVNDEFSSLVKNLSDSNRAADKQKKLRKQEDDERKKSIFSGQKFRSGTEKIAFMFTELAIAGSKVLEANKQYITTSDDMFKAGVNILNGNNSTLDGFTALNQMVNLTGLRLETLQKSVLKYSSAINTVGLTKFTKSLAQAIPAMAKIGFNSEEAADLMGTYIESQATYNNLRGKSEKEIAQQSIEFGARLTKMSLALGQSREQMLEQIKANSKSAESYQVAAVYGTNAAKNIDALSAALPELKDSINDTASAIDPVYSKVYKELNQAGNGEIANAFAKMVTDVRAGITEPTKAMEQFRTQYGTRLQEAARNMQALTSTGEASSKEALASMTKMAYAVNKVTDATDGQTSGAKDTKRASSEMQTQFEKTAATLQAAFSPTISQLEALTTVVSILNESTYNLVKTIGPATLSIIGATAIIGSFGLALIGAIAKLNTWSNLLSSTGGNNGSTGGRNRRTGGRPGRGSRIAAGVKGGIIGTVVGVGSGYAADALEERGHTKLAAGADVLGSAATGAGVGAMLGSIIPGLGNAIGAAIGGVIGGGAGLYQNWNKITAPNNGDVQSKNVTKINTPPSSSVSSPKPNTPDIKSPVVNTPPTDKTDINSQIAYQNAVLEQILQGTNTLVSVNRDILKFTRVQS